MQSIVFHDKNGLILQLYYFYGNLHQVGHAHSQACTDISGVAYQIFAPVYHHAVAIDRHIEGHCRCEVHGIVEQGYIEPQQLVYQIDVQDGTVFTIAIGLEEDLIDKQRSLIAKLLLIGLIGKPRLHKIE